LEPSYPVDEDDGEEADTIPRSSEQVRQVLKSGVAGSNDSFGPQSALAFALMNDRLTHKIVIVKMLLAYCADPSVTP
jgi:hypothetical protein